MIGQDSLPLMGIVNDSLWKLWKITYWTSLPLMGIVNTLRMPEARMCTSAHYPSWGS